MNIARIVLLAVGIIAVVILAYFIFRPHEQPPPEPEPNPEKESQHVEINAPEGTQVFSKVPGKKEMYLGNAPATVEVPIGAIIILRYKDKERVISAKKVKEGKISDPFPPINPIPPITPISFDLVSINAVPWAEVFIKPPGTNYFIEPRAQNFTRGSERTGENRNVTQFEAK